LDGIPKHLPALLRAEKLVKKARKAKVLPDLHPVQKGPAPKLTKTALARELFELVQSAQAKGWSAEELLRAETSRRERGLRKIEAADSKA
jgi:hypothetical protein